jgi:glycerol-3-phosphate dehydrogenase
METGLPTRVRVLVLGGGIHGVGVVHDLASRGWRDVLLVEKDTVGHGTSSRSTKLIHGGLRYLRRISQFGMVAESLKERKLLIDLAGDLVKPIEFYYPILKKGGSPAIAIKTGLFLYDFLAGRQRLHRHSKVDLQTVAAHAPNLDLSKVSKVYSYFDGQTDDLALVQRVASSAVNLGAQIFEHTKVVKITPCDDGWNVDLKLANGQIKTISTLYIVNGLGPWAHSILEESGLKPTHAAVNNKGVHLILRNSMGLDRGLFLESPDDGRIFFMIPWLEHVLLGTTEEKFDRNPDLLDVSEQDVNYLLERCNRYLHQPIVKNDIISHFAGLRWLAVDQDRSLTKTSRESVVGEIVSNRGLLLTIYGGKLTSYRSLCEKIGNRITEHFGEFRPSKTAEAVSWVTTSDLQFKVPSLLERFSSY